MGAVLAGVLANVLGASAAVWSIAALTAASGLVFAVGMYETHRPTTFDVDPVRAG